ncbi:MAG: hypothetical protein QS98_C0010G0058 [archaeon GW2011_AR3]|nr:MAG: hypothetical protein QS98_C0010G0058 [archaeon GW2011_AR3]MBS3110197.1 hypothetical protein [Candidatus Woesearchaeota archaeon]
MENKTKPYGEFDGKFCKVVIRTSSGEKALKGIISIFDQTLMVSGDYQQTSVQFSEILRISTKEVINENKKEDNEVSSKNF